MTENPEMSRTTPRDFSGAYKPNLNWFDKVIWAMAKLAVGDTKSNVYVVKIVFAGSLLVGVSMVYRVFWKVVGIFDFAPPTTSLFLALLYALCCVPVFWATHSAEEIASADLSGWVRWMYTALGFLIFPVSVMVGGLLLAFLE